MKSRSSLLRPHSTPVGPRVPELINLLYPALLLLFWFLFGLYSPTAHNHGRWVAFLMPLAPVIFLMVYVMLAISRLILYPVFVVAGKKQAYEDLVQLVKHPYLWGAKSPSNEPSRRPSPGGDPSS